MKLIVYGPGGVLENVTFLVGFDNLCFMIADDPDLAQDVFDAVGSRLVRYYEHCAPMPRWARYLQRRLGPSRRRRCCARRICASMSSPGIKRIVETIHAAGKPAILHSCGNLER